MVSFLSHDDMSAWRSATKLNQIAPGSREEMYVSCLYTYGNGQSSLAVANCSRVTQAYPEDNTAHSNLGWAALDADQFTLASKEFAQAYALVKDKWKDLSYVQVIDSCGELPSPSFTAGTKKIAKSYFNT
jgi:hypothetical protein